jgi:hypothetical protein
MYIYCRMREKTSKTDEKRGRQEAEKELTMGAEQHVNDGSNDVWEPAYMLCMLLDIE